MLFFPLFRTSYPDYEEILELFRVFRDHPKQPPDPRQQGAHGQSS